MSGKATFFIFLCIISFVLAQPEGINYDEAKVPVFELPDPLVMLDEPKVQDSQTWIDKGARKFCHCSRSLFTAKHRRKKSKSLLKLLKTIH